jgi:transcriptional regulator with GAF, ATPase, and Fis domain
VLNAIQAAPPRERALIEGALALTSHLDVADTCDAMLDVVEGIFDAQSAWILLYDSRSDRLVTAAFRGPAGATYADVDVPSNEGIVGLAFSTGEPVFVPDVAHEDRWFNPDRVHGSGLPSVFTVPLLYGDERIGALGFYSPKFGPDALPSPADRALVQGLGAVASLGIRNARLFQQVTDERGRRVRLHRQRRQLRNEIGALRGEIREARGANGIIGDSAAIEAVLEQVQMVASADTTVLLLGETGTGKELFARAIHEGSRRARNVFLPVNCAAMPPTLLESELFGHEKGAFTGAIDRKAGKFELADRGTLFLDEIGELPPEAQAKLLRVLQDGQVHRIGGLTPITVNVRVVAATNQDLAGRMQSGEFRPDLYYRLSVFPIVLPPLRDRQGDIPALVAHFIRHFAARQHVMPPRLAPGALELLCGYDWPGNVRELQNVIERAVILARHGEITPGSLPLSGPAFAPANPRVAAVAPAPAPAPPREPVPFAEAERRAILDALQATGWRVSGPDGAARLLGLKPTTLHAKMKKLAIRRPTAGANADGHQQGEAAAPEEHTRHPDDDVHATTT